MHVSAAKHLHCHGRRKRPSPWCGTQSALSPFVWHPFHPSGNGPRQRFSSGSRSHRTCATPVHRLRFLRETPVVKDNPALLTCQAPFKLAKTAHKEFPGWFITCSSPSPRTTFSSPSKDQTACMHTLQSGWHANAPLSGFVLSLLLHLRLHSPHSSDNQCRRTPRSPQLLEARQPISTHFRSALVCGLEIHKAPFTTILSTFNYKCQRKSGISI